MRRPRILAWVLRLLAVLALAAASALLFRAVVCFRIARADAIASPPGIEWSGYVAINGVPQWMVIRGRDARNPVLLYLHGGPGSPDTLLAGRRYSREIEERFVTVHWDQRGTCKSYRPALEAAPLTTAQLASDVDAVTLYLLSRFHRQKLYLIGHSWGSLLGVLAISAHPERYAGFIGVGQFVNAVDEERISLHFALDFLARTGDRAGYRKLAAMGEPPYARPFESIVRQRAVLMRAGGASGPGSSPWRLLRESLLSPQYDLLDLWRFAEGMGYSLRGGLNSAYWDVALDRTHREFRVPVCFFIGHRDYNTPFELVERYYGQISAPRKEKVIFERAGHMIPYEEPERFNRETVRVFYSACGLNPFFASTP